MNYHNCSLVACSQLKIIQNYPTFVAFCVLGQNLQLVSLQGRHFQCGERIRIKQKFPDTLKNPPFSSLLFNNQREKNAVLQCKAKCPFCKHVCYKNPKTLFANMVIKSDAEHKLGSLGHY